MEIGRLALAVPLVLACCVFGCAEAPAAGAPAPEPFVTSGVDELGLPILASGREQARMEAWIDARYERRFVRATFRRGPDDIDCVDFDRQPGCQAGGCPHVAVAASAPTPGAAPSCPAGTVGIVRAKIEAMRHFPTLEAYLHPPKGAPQMP
jgi:hypothetical protein